MATKLGIINSALFIIGANEINSLNDATREARVADQLYDPTAQSLLQTHPWVFSLAMTTLAGQTLTTTSAEYKFGYDYEYTLPPDLLRVIRKNEPSNDYRIIRNKLYTSDNEVQILYQYKASESQFPSYFTRALEFAMAELFAAALLQDESQVEVWRTIKERELVRAKNIDSTQAPPVEIDPSNFSLTNIR